MLELRADRQHRPAGGDRQGQRGRRVSACPADHGVGAVDGTGRRSRRSGRGWAGRARRNPSATRSEPGAPRRRRRSRSARRTRLPLVTTSGRSSARSSRWCSGVYGRNRPTWSVPGWTPPARGLAGRAGTSTIGRAGETSSRPVGAVNRPRPAAAATSTDHDGEGLAGPVLACPQRATLARLVASQTSWYPPRPLTATMRPPASAATAASSAASLAAAALAGAAAARWSPRQSRPAIGAGHRLGVEPPVGRVAVFGGAAPGRAGSRPSRCGPGRRAARRRSSPAGPQFVQLTNGYRYRRSAGSNSSRRQSVAGGQVGGQAGEPRPAASGRVGLSTTAKPAPGDGAAPFAASARHLRHHGVRRRLVRAPPGPAPPPPAPARRPRSRTSPSTLRTVPSSPSPVASR